MNTPNLETDFLGVSFPNPCTLSSAPPTTTGEVIMRAFDAGWSAAITESLTVAADKTVNVTPRLATLGSTDLTIGGIITTLTAALAHWWKATIQVGGS